jgi:hypothetical protein
MRAGLSRRAYARHRAARGLPGATDRAVRRALHTGRIALSSDGTIDAEAADQAWRATTPPRGFQNGRPMAETLARLDREARTPPVPGNLMSRPLAALDELREQLGKMIAPLWRLHGQHADCKAVLTRVRRVPDLLMALEEGMIAAGVPLFERDMPAKRSNPVHPNKERDR